MNKDSESSESSVSPSFFATILREGFVLIAVCALAVIGTLSVAESSRRGEIMFMDGDSMIVALLSQSFLSGSESDWGMSAVLFVPETLIYSLLSLSGLGVAQLQFLNGVVNIVILYIAFRLLSSILTTNRKHQIIVSVVAVSVLVLLMSLEGTGRRGSIELASLMVMTTYYSGTILLGMFTLYLAFKTVMANKPSSVLLFLLYLVVVVSAFSNPLFIAWFVLPIIACFFVTRYGLKHEIPSLIVVSSVLLSGALTGYLLRIPMKRWIVASGGNYLHPGNIASVPAYYLSLIQERLNAPYGIVSIFIIVLLFILCLVFSVNSLRGKGDTSAVLISTFGWLAPVAITVGFIILGAKHARYLQPWCIATVAIVLVVGVAVANFLEKQEFSGKKIIQCSALGGVLVLSFLLLLLSIPRVKTVTDNVDKTLECAVTWIDSQDSVGAGPWWTIRPLKTHLKNPRQLIQVDSDLAPGEWLADRKDFDIDSISFIVTDKNSGDFSIPDEYKKLPFQTIDCGVYTIQDYRPAKLKIEKENL